MENIDLNILGIPNGLVPGFLRLYRFQKPKKKCRPVVGSSALKDRDDKSSTVFALKQRG